MASSSKNSAGKANLLGKRNTGDDLETRPILKKQKEKSEKDTTEGFVDSLQQKQSDQEAALIKTLFVGRLPRKTKISDIIHFFRNAGEVQHVRLVVNRKGEHTGCGFVEFATPEKAKKALSNISRKADKSLHGCEIFIDMAKIASNPPKYCIDHKLWYKDYLRREGLLIEEDKTVDRLVEEVPARKKTLFVSLLSPHAKIIHVNNFFLSVGKVVSVRLIVNKECKHVGYGFVEFSCASEAKEALKKRNGVYLFDHRIFLQVAKIAPHPPQPNCNLAEKLCYEDYLRQESLIGDETVEGLVEAVALRKRTLFVSNLSHQIKISDIVSFFKDVGKVVNVRLLLHKGKHVSNGFVEFASVKEAKKVLKEKNRGILLERQIFLTMAEMAPEHKYCIDHKVCYEDDTQESLLIEDETVEGFVEEVPARKKTLFVANLSPETTISDVKIFFQDAGEAVNRFKQIVGDVVSVRLIVNREGKHMGCGFVDFASADAAMRALGMKNGESLRGSKIYLQEAEM